MPGKRKQDESSSSTEKRPKRGAKAAAAAPAPTEVFDVNQYIIREEEMGFEVLRVDRDKTHGQVCCAHLITPLLVGNGLLFCLACIPNINTLSPVAFFSWVVKGTHGRTMS